MKNIYTCSLISDKRFSHNVPYHIGARLSDGSVVSIALDPDNGGGGGAGIAGSSNVIVGT